MKKCKIIFFTMMSILILSPIGEQIVRAETLCVNPGGTGGCYDSIQAAIDASGAIDTAMQSGGDRLAALQNDDGGWDWPLDDGNPTNASPSNTVGPIAMGLAQAYLRTGDSDHLTALQNAGGFLLAKTNTFSPSDGYLAAMLDQVFGVTTYTDHVTTYFYDELAAGTYDRKGLGTLYSTASYVQLIRDSRSGAIANLAAWDIGMGLVGAALVGASTAEWIAGVKAEIDELDGTAWYDVIGLAGAVYGLAFVGEDFDPTAGEHAAAGSLSDLAAILAGYQIDGGGFSWSSLYLNPGEGNETIQETAYAILALDEVDRNGYLIEIQGAANYMRSVQLVTGGWENYAGDGENNEITGEALWGHAIVYPAGGTTINVAAGTYEEQVVIDKDLTVVGAGKDVTVIQSPTSLTEFFTTSGDNYPIVYIHDTDNVAIEELTVDGLGRGNSNYRFIGIGFWNAGGSVTNVHLTAVRDTPFSGTQHGVSIYAHNNTDGPYSIDISGVDVDDMQKNGMALSGNGLTANVSNSTVIGNGPTDVTAQNGIQIGYGATGSITGCEVSYIVYTPSSWSASGLLLYSPAPGMNLSNNNIHDCEGGLQAYWADDLVVNNNNTFSQNDFAWILGGNGATVTNNTFTNNNMFYMMVALYLSDTTNITVSNNTFVGNDMAVVIDGLATNVSFTGNHITNSSIAAVTVMPYLSDEPTGVVLSNNNISGNGFGIENTTSNMVDAQYNWWGDASGPYDGVGDNEDEVPPCTEDPTTELNSDGTGDEVSDNVDYCPWLMYLAPDIDDDGICNPYVTDPSCVGSDNCPETPNPGQEDTYPPGGNGIGDACECEGDFDCDGDVDGTDVSTFKLYFGRTPVYYPCGELNPCHGDFDCDEDVDGTDVVKFKEDFGRGQFSNPCPACAVGDWCSY